MLKALFILAVMVTSPALAAKGPCKGVNVEQDAFSKKEVASANGRIWARYWLDWEARSEEGSPRLKLILVKAELHEVPLDTGYEVLLLLGEGTVHPLATSEQTAAVAGANENGVYTTWPAEFSLSKQDLIDLSMRPITAIRAELPGGEANWTVKKGMQKKLMQVFGCFAGKLKE